ncbi:unnamed protein product, partial [Effrenium voratum]
VMMMAVTAAVALYDDLQRKKADEEINNSLASVVVRGSEVKRKFQDIRVGDVLRIRKDEEFPADTVPLYCSGDGGNCYVSTANLDGETNLKLKTAPEATQMLFRGGDQLGALARLDAEIHAEAPNGNIHDFSGNISVGAQKLSLGPKQLLMRGTVLRNTESCLCLAVYTGPDTRMVRNSRPAPMKQSNLERTTNQAMLMVLATQTVISGISSLCHLFMKPPKSHWYLEEEEIVLPEFIGWWLTFFTLYSNLMPISLYPTVEFCNAFQCWQIQHDEQMLYQCEGFNEGRPFSARTRSTNLSQELGQVGYLFSDKTGTLTQNDMVLRRVSIGGLKFGSFQEKRPQDKLGLAEDDGFNGGPELQDRRSSMPSIDQFLEVLAVSHTVMVTRGKATYEAESPDEYALVKAAAGLGWEFQGRRGTELTVGVASSNYQASARTYNVLATNAFNSSRKRMSVLVQRGMEYSLLVKGADNVMLQRAAQQNQKVLDADLQAFSEQGLRTLVIGRRSLSSHEAQAWLGKFQEAHRSTTDRDAKLEQVAEEIEHSLDIVGATAIEDKLQDGVPETIERIRNAGIKLWVLTGDKLETARNIGYSTKVLTTQMDIRILDAEMGQDLDMILRSWDVSMDSSSDEEGMGQSVVSIVQRELADGESLAHRGLLVTGKELTKIWESDDLMEKFQRLSTSCGVLIACRVSPLQKAELVQFIRDRVQPQPVTLAVGDGANDVPMIQTAQVGVGIAGKEGRQAVNNSDFAIAQFRYLERLLLLHGRWNYRRACMFTLFTFWRNMVQVLMIACYTFISGFSGTCLFEDWIRLTFNGVCTMPILPPGCLDEDFKEEVVLKHPDLYQVGPRSEDLNVGKVGMTILVAFLHASVLLIVTVLAFPGLESTGSGDYYTFGTICYTCLIIDVNYRATFLSSRKSRKYTAQVALLAFGMYVLWLMFDTGWLWVCNKLTPNMYSVPVHMIKNAYFYFCVLAVPLIAFVFDMFFHWFYHRIYNPDRGDLLQKRLEEKEHEGSSDGFDCLESSDADAESQVSNAEMQALMIDCNSADLSPDLFCSIPYHRQVIIVALAGWLVLWAFAGVCYWQSTEKTQLRIVYDENSTKGKGGSTFIEDLFLRYPIGTMPDETHSAHCTPLPGSNEKSCELTVTLPHDITDPMLFYSVGPIYQNDNAYMKSEVVQELYGQEAPAGKREQRCPERVREWDGLPLVPCGLKAQSLFNDTFEVVGHTIDHTDIAWQQDIDRYGNTSDYPQPDKGRWLFQVFPESISKELNVKDEDFVNWMRPSAVPRVWNRVGFLKETLYAGQTYTIKMQSRFNVATIPGGFKSLVITEHSELFGTRHDGFAYVLGFAGLICLLMGLAVVPLKRFV